MEDTGFSIDEVTKIRVQATLGFQLGARIMTLETGTGTEACKEIQRVN